MKKGKSKILEDFTTLQNRDVFVFSVGKILEDFTTLQNRDVFVFSVGKILEDFMPRKERGKTPELRGQASLKQGGFIIQALVKGKSSPDDVSPREIENFVSGRVVQRLKTYIPVFQRCEIILDFEW